MLVHNKHIFECSRLGPRGETENSKTTLLRSQTLFLEHPGQ